MFKNSNDNFLGFWDSKLADSNWLVWFIDWESTVFSCSRNSSLGFCITVWLRRMCNYFLGSALRKKPSLFLTWEFYLLFDEVLIKSESTRLLFEVALLFSSCPFYSPCLSFLVSIEGKFAYEF